MSQIRAYIRRLGASGALGPSTGFRKPIFRNGFYMVPQAARIPAEAFPERGWSKSCAPVVVRFSTADGVMQDVSFPSRID